MLMLDYWLKFHPHNTIKMLYAENHCLDKLLVPSHYETIVYTVEHSKCLYYGKYYLSTIMKKYFKSLPQKSG